VKKTSSTLIFWLVAAVALVLLAPYAGVHILTSPPATDEQEELSSTSLPPTLELSESAEEPDMTDSDDKPIESLDEIRGLLAE
jgi:hypothetical protein